MSKWNFEKPDGTNLGEHVYALVVYTGDANVGVRCLERGYVREQWKAHVFAWMDIMYPSFSINEIETIINIRKITPTNADKC